MKKVINIPSDVVARMKFFFCIMHAAYIKLCLHLVYVVFAKNKHKNLKF